MWPLLLLLVAGRAGADPPDQHPVSSRPVKLTIGPNATVRIYVDHKDPDDAFFLFSCHCRTGRLLMHSTEGIFEESYVNSTDPAMVTFNGGVAPLHPEPFVFVTNPWSRPVSVLALARHYSASDPVPGWCTTWDWVRPKPFLSIAWDSSVIRLNFSRASLLHDDLKCNEKGKFEYEIYHRYLQESTDSADQDEDFADSIKSFLDVESIKKKGTLVSSLGGHIDRLVFASYPPIGSLYAVIVHYQNANSTGSALYGLGHTYGCHIDPDTGVCSDDSHVVTKIVCGLAVFVGLVMAFAGHRFFITSQFLFGFYAGSFIGFILLNFSASWSFAVNFSLTMVSGLAGAALASLLWLLLGIPVLSVFLPTIELGVLAASILMFTPPLNVASLTVDLYYWLVFLCLVLALPGVLLAFTQKASILSCVVIGTYTTVIPIDYFLGTNLRYISINVLRRATVPEFREAVILPALQTSDLALLACWLGLALAALVTQLLLERGKAPFPPSPLLLLCWRRELDLLDADGETAPLVEGEVTMAGSEVAVAGPVVGYILGYSSVATGLPVQGPVMAGREGPGDRAGEVRQEARRAARDSNSSRTSNSSRGRDIFKPPSPTPPSRPPPRVATRGRVSVATEGGLPPYSPALL